MRSCVVKHIVWHYIEYINPVKTKNEFSPKIDITNLHSLKSNFICGTIAYFKILNFKTVGILGRNQTIYLRDERRVVN